MKKRVSQIMTILLIIVGLAFSLNPIVNAKLSIAPLIGYYSPSFGEINPDLSEFNNYYSTDLKLQGGISYGISVEYEFTPKFSFRGEVFNFNAKTSASGIDEWIYIDYDYYYGYDLYMYYTDNTSLEGKAQVTPIFLNAVYKISPGQSFSPYVGAGVGTLLSNFNFNWNGELIIDYWLYDWWYSEWYYWFTESAEYTFSDGDTGNPMGLQILAGLDFVASPNLSFAIEGRYIIGKSEFQMPTYEGLDIAKTTIDWGGFFVGTALRFRFLNEE